MSYSLLTPVLDPAKMLQLKAILVALYCSPLMVFFFIFGSYLSKYHILSLLIYLFAKLSFHPVVAFSKADTDFYLPIVRYRSWHVSHKALWVY